MTREFTEEIENHSIHYLNVFTFKKVVKLIFLSTELGDGRYEHDFALAIFSKVVIQWNYISNSAGFLFQTEEEEFYSYNKNNKGTK